MMEQRWLEIQKSLQEKLDLQDGFSVENVTAVGGFDISYVKESVSDACASFVVLSFPSLNVLYSDCQPVVMTEPYISGFLAFREVDHLVNLYTTFIEEFQVHMVEPPQVSLVDGNGILHHHRVGLASHLGIMLQIPTIGVGKSLLYVDGLKKEEVLKGLEDEKQFQLIGDSGFNYGMALIGSGESSNPIYISPGHMVSRKTSCDIALACCRFRVPEPVRQADLLSREWNRNHHSQQIIRMDK